MVKRIVLFFYPIIFPKNDDEEQYVANQKFDSPITRVSVTSITCNFSSSSSFQLWCIDSTAGALAVITV